MINWLFFFLFISVNLVIWLPVILLICSHSVLCIWSPDSPEQQHIISHSVSFVHVSLASCKNTHTPFLTSTPNLLHITPRAPPPHCDSSQSLSLLSHSFSFSGAVVQSKCITLWSTNPFSADTYINTYKRRVLSTVCLFSVDIVLQQIQKRCFLFSRLSTDA